MKAIASDLIMHPASLAAFVFAGMFAFIWLFLSVASPILFTLALAAMFYAALSPTVDNLERRDVNKGAAVAIVMVMVVALMLGLTALLYPAISGQFEHFSSRSEQLDDRILALCVQIDAWARAHLGSGFDTEEAALSAVNDLSTRSE